MGLRQHLLSAIVLPLALAALSGPARAHRADTPNAAATADAELENVLVQHASKQLRLDPLGFAVPNSSGDPDDFAATFTDARWLKVAQLTERSRMALGRIDRANLSPSSALEYDVLAYDLARETAWQRAEIAPLARVLPLDHFDGLQLFYASVASGDGLLLFETAADYEAMLARHRLLPGVFDRAIAHYREGRAAGLMMGKPAVLAMIAQLDDLLALPAIRSPFARPLQAFPATIDSEKRDALATRYLAVIREDVIPAYRRLREFLAEDYLPSAPAASGLAGSENGAALYRALIWRHTTLELAPDDVYRLGKGEVERIGQELLATGRTLGLEGGLAEMAAQARRDPRFTPDSAQQLERRLLEVAERVWDQLPLFFHHRPEKPISIERYPLWAEASAPGGGYARAHHDTPATFFFNAHDIETRSLAAAASLYLHEALPGHHLEASATDRASAISTYRRQVRYTAFTEGWALYAETLGYEMELYDDPLNRWGTLEEEMLRALRLVVDTGLHDRGWSRERAAEYMLAHSSMSEAEAYREVDRYIAAPGQALAYKIGALTIQDLRGEAETALGDRFDLRDFHDAVLGAGPLPLPILEKRVRAWIAATR